MEVFSDCPPSYSRLEELPPPGHAVSQQQQSVIVVNSGPPSVVYHPPLVQSFSCHIVLSCLTFWFCGFLFGFIAFLLAVIAQSYSTSMNISDRQKAHILGKWSIGMSLTGIFVVIVVTIVVVCVTMTSAGQAYCENHPC